MAPQEVFHYQETRTVQAMEVGNRDEEIPRSVGDVLLDSWWGPETTDGPESHVFTP